MLPFFEAHIKMTLSHTTTIFNIFLSVQRPSVKPTSSYALNSLNFLSVLRVMLIASIPLKAQIYHLGLLFQLQIFSFSLSTGIIFSHRLLAFDYTLLPWTAQAISYLKEGTAHPSAFQESISSPLIFLSATMGLSPTLSYSQGTHSQPKTVWYDMDNLFIFFSSKFNSSHSGIKETNDGLQ